MGKRLDTAPTMPPPAVESFARDILQGASSTVPGMSELAKRHVEGGVYINSRRIPLRAPASRVHISWGPRPGWTGYIRGRLSRVARRDALAWIVASVALVKLRTGASYGDELVVARAIKMPLGPFLEAAFKHPEARKLARAFDVTVAEVQARCAEVANV